MRQCGGWPKANRSLVIREALIKLEEELDGKSAEEVFRYFDLDWKAHVVIDQKFFRPAEVLEWRADIGKIRKELGWSPKTTFGDIVKLMAKTDLENAKAEVAAL